MTEVLLALVPTYGLWLIFAAVLLACLGLPMPASIIVLTAGAFAAAENFALWQVLGVTALAYICGDQLAYALGRRMGAPLVSRAENWPSVAPFVARGSAMVAQRGSGAVLLSHTVLAQVGPYVTYICGATSMSWRAFTIAAAPGALIWSLAYVMLGFTFATQLTQIMSIVANFATVFLAAALLAIVGRYLWRAWKKFN